MKTNTASPLAGDTMSPHSKMQGKSWEETKGYTLGLYGGRQSSLMGFKDLPTNLCTALH